MKRAVLGYVQLLPDLTLRFCEDPAPTSYEVLECGHVTTKHYTRNGTLSDASWRRCDRCARGEPEDPLLLRRVAPLRVAATLEGRL